MFEIILDCRNITFLHPVVEACPLISSYWSFCGTSAAWKKQNKRTLWRCHSCYKQLCEAVSVKIPWEISQISATIEKLWYTSADEVVWTLLWTQLIYHINLVTEQVTILFSFLKKNTTALLHRLLSNQQPLSLTKWLCKTDSEEISPCNVPRQNYEDTGSPKSTMSFYDKNYADEQWFLLLLKKLPLLEHPQDWFRSWAVRI